MTITRDHDVVGLKISMHDTRGMSFRQSFGHMLQVPQQLTQCGSLTMYLLAEGNSFQKFHADEGRTFDFPDFENLCNVGMPKGVARLRFSSQAIHWLSIHC